MKIVLAGGGTGGHFYPLIAVAEAVRDLAAERRLIAPRIYFIAPSPFDEEALFENEIVFIKSSAGKMRRYTSILNFFDIFITLWGTLSCIVTLFRIYPDVVLSKGGYTSVPVVLAAHLLRIPIVIHESDARPGRANILASKYARHIGVAFPDVVALFPEKVRSKIALTGIPIRKRLRELDAQTGTELLQLDATVPTVLILGGSLGSKKINDTVLGGLLDLVGSVNVVHQTGKDNFKDVEATAKVILNGTPNASRYHVFPYLSLAALQQAAGAAHLVVSRAGAGTIAEIALWRRPAILIPIPETVSHDQRTNAYAYAHMGAAIVLEQENMTPHLLVSEIRRITGDAALSSSMSAKSAEFGSGEAARIIADDLLSISLEHEPLENQSV